VTSRAQAAPAAPVTSRARAALEESRLHLAQRRAMTGNSAPAPSAPAPSAPEPSASKKLVSKTVKEAPSFLSRHKGKLLAGAGAAALAAGGAGLYSRNKDRSKTAGPKGTRQPVDRN
jgi:hypothetical protein